MIIPAAPTVNRAIAAAAGGSGGSKRNDYRNDYIANEGTRGIKYKNATGLDNCRLPFSYIYRSELLLREHYVANIGSYHRVLTREAA
jgi:hypothetical protein